MISKMLASLTAIAMASLTLGANAQIVPDNLIATSLSGTLSAAKYTGVGGSGTYNQVTNMIAGEWPTCTANPSCITTPKTASGPLAPFDEDMTFNFRGPMHLYNVAVYQPANTTAATWKRVSDWSQNQAPDNMVFMNNLGGGNSGIWTICGGNSQSYASGDWTDTVATPNAELFSGDLPTGKEINILTATECNGRNCNGFYRGAAHLGWEGSKMIVIDYDMPSDPTNLPAIWALNGQVVRAAQYGCNCRGVGSPGGCGELDIAETLTPNAPHAISEIYSFKGATGLGDNNWFPRVGSRMSIAVVFDIKTDQISILHLSNFDYSQIQLPRSLIDGYLSAPAFPMALGNPTRRSAHRFLKRHH